MPTNATNKIKYTTKAYRDTPQQSLREKTKVAHLVIKEAAEEAEFEKLLTVKKDRERYLCESKDIVRVRV